ncbi:MAG: hypothetical protein KGL39_22425 [Patescibacteria group bacterium]|nr:hypothetical protein [Patescibacteria group bacterium]
MAIESMLSAANALPFILGGNSTFTLRSAKTGTRYTYKVRAARRQYKDQPPLHFVKVLTGPDNGGSYTYIGAVKGGKFGLTAASKMAADSGPVVAFRWVLEKLVAGIAPQNVEIWHAGKCGRCGRTLTVPESIACGLGPECAGKVA